MPNNYEGPVPNDEVIPGVSRINHIISWKTSQPFEGRQSGPGVPRFSPAFEQAALVKLMSLEAEARDLGSLNEIAELMEEAPGA